ncbi:BadF/BadG/BcrA/BcrD ATPase family protein [soil metagenome]
MPDARRILAIDAGQTGIRTVVVEADGSRGEEREFPGIRTDTPLIPQLADVVARVAADGNIDTVSVGSTGLTVAETDPAGLRDASAASGVTTAYLAHDSITSYLGALGNERGVVVAAGTGVVTLAVGATEVARVDGWGYLMGDAGSGFWIGRAALEAVMRGHDGRGPATALTEFARAEFVDLEQAYIELQSDAGRVRRIAGYARWVSETADTDAVSARISADAAAELVVSVATGLRRVGEGESTAPIVCGLGGVLRSPAIASAFVSGLSSMWPQVDIRTTRGSGLDGAALLPSIDTSSALHPLIASSAG